MTLSDVLDKVADYRETNGCGPQRAFVSPMTARGFSSERFTISDSGGWFGSNALGVLDWYADPKMPDGEIRLEP